MKINYTIATALSIGLIVSCNQKKEPTGSGPSVAENKVAPNIIILPQEMAIKICYTQCYDNPGHSMWQLKIIINT